jgi:hypothetical protein
MGTKLYLSLAHSNAFLEDFEEALRASVVATGYSG